MEWLRQLGIPVTFDTYGPGTHDWPYRQRELHRSLPLLLAALQTPTRVRVYDIYPPRVPESCEIAHSAAAGNPDRDREDRRYDEVEPAVRNPILATREVRFAPSPILPVRC